VYVFQLTGPQARHEALLIGKHTLVIDNPMLTVRHVKGKNPVRVIWCTDAVENNALHVFNSMASTVFIKNGYGTSDAIHWYLQKTSPKALDVAELLYSYNLQSVLIEGGAKVLQQFIAEGLANRIVKIVNPELFLKKGVKAPSVQITNAPYNLGNDLVFDVKY
jgi:diaminohydroxyphosphoribosylaminopyrimidine deaminase/5-amino-6-(5-phosphoribosylamino)uracil reductase